VIFRFSSSLTGSSIPEREQTKFRMDAIKKKMEKLANETGEAEARIIKFET
jgi:hypothetical protein